jgi:hypothetical protein
VPVSRRASAAQRNNRAASPPLEKDEKEFTQTARGMQKRKLSMAAPPPAGPEALNPSAAAQDVESDLFGLRGAAALASALASSPAIGPKTSAMPSVAPAGDWTGAGEPWDTRSPETVGFDELDTLFDEM